METYIYSLDLSLNSTGICLFTNDGKFIKALTIDTHAEKESKLKLKVIGDELIKLIKRYTPEVVVIEQGFTLYNISTQALFKVHGIANYLFSDYEQIYYPASTVKKVVGGKGNMSKIEIHDIICKEYPEISFRNYDESDAFATALCFFKKNKKL